MVKLGRPLKFATPQDLQKAVDLYFISLESEDKEGNIVHHPPTISGLAYALDIETASLRSYEKRDAFFSIIKRAKQKVEIALEQRLYENAPTGSIFNLKCNFGYRDNADSEKEGDSLAEALLKLADKLPD